MRSLLPTLALVLAGICLADLTDHVLAQSGASAEDAAAIQADLDEVRASITVSDDRAAALAREIAAMGDDRAQLNAELIAAAQRVRLAEIEVGDVEERLLALRAEESRIKVRLEDEDGSVVSLVAALQRIGRSPPPALIVDPADALSSARSAVLLSAVLPQLRERAARVLTDLNALQEVRLAVEAEEATLRRNLSTLGEERLRIATLIEARKRGVVRAGEALEAEQQRAEELAAEASTLAELIATMESEIGSVSDAADAARAADEDADGPALTSNGDDPVRLAFANPDRTGPAVPFSGAKGYLELPASGVRVLDFGAPDGFGGVSQGVFIVTRAEAQVVAPADGWVVYKGPYLNYGQIVILNAGLGYNIVLAGLDSTAVELGQFVLMGEPLGQMGTRTTGQTVATSAGMSRPTLYIEIRSDGAPIDPSEWWAPAPPETLEG